LNQPREILIVKPSSLGDIVHTLPAVVLIKQRWPSAKLRWLVNAEWAPLLEGSPHVDEILIFPRRDFRGARGSLRIAPWARSLRDRVDADLVLDFQGLLRSALIAKLCRGAGGRIVGLSDAREGARFFYDQRVDVSDCAHAVDRYLALVRALGIVVPETLCWPLPEGVPPAGFDATERFVVLHPFSRGRGKSLSVPDVEALCRALAPRRVVIVGQSKEPVTQIPNVIDLLNRTTLLELIWLLRRSVFVVSVDSGPMHIAAALGTPLVSIHTWSNPAKVGPYNRNAWVWKDGALAQVLDLAHTHPVPDIAALAAFVSQRI
jgi:lipopolysaccharide heptosyltransferase I